MIPRPDRRLQAGQLLLCLHIEGGEGTSNQKYSQQRTRWSSSGSQRKCEVIVRNTLSWQDLWGEILITKLGLAFIKANKEHLAQMIHCPRDTASIKVHQSTFGAILDLKERASLQFVQIEYPWWEGDFKRVIPKPGNDMLESHQSTSVGPWPDMISYYADH
jgi:hypothetical protein